MTDILIVEDEPKIASLLNDYLSLASYTCEIQPHGNEAITHIKRSEPQLILLDIMLPGMDGTEILRELRKFSNVPVIMLTAKVEEIDRLIGLELGADDYICKPFSPREVVARIKAVLRRAHNSDFSSAILQLDDDRYEATIAGNKLPLTKTEFSLLRRLSAHPGHVFSREKLIDGIYDDNRIVTTRTVDTHIKNIRKKIAQHFDNSEVIHSIYGVGYKYEIQ